MLYEVITRFYGRSRDAYYDELRSLLRYSMNFVDEPSKYRTKPMLDHA